MGLGLGVHAVLHVEHVHALAAQLQPLEEALARVRVRVRVRSGQGQGSP